jgi:hypothetical protein
MAHREFDGTDGRHWVVWSVQPEYAERRGLSPTRSQPAVPPPAVERREHHEFRVSLGGKLSQGWLCFETDGEKRRLSPVPMTWETLPHAELEALCATASKVQHPSRTSADK